MAVDIGRALAHGLRTRGVEDTVQGAPAESQPGAADPRRTGKLTSEREAQLIALAMG